MNDSFHDYPANLLSAYWSLCPPFVDPLSSDDQQLQQMTSNDRCDRSLPFTIRSAAYDDEDQKLIQYKAMTQNK